MPPMQGNFDATQHQPKQGFDKHPCGKFPARITGTSIEATKDNTGGMFVIEYTTQAGSMLQRLNIWNANAQAVQIAHGQLSAVCHAVGIFKLDWQNEGAALRGANCQIEIGWQKGSEPSAEKPDGGYVEIKKVFDANGNEPGKPAAAPQPMQQQPQAVAQGNWVTPANGQGAPPANNSAPGGWQPGPNVNAAPAPNTGNPAAQWSQSPQGGNPNPPWGQK